MRAVVQVTRRFLLWIVAGIAAFQAWVQVIVEGLNRRLDLVVVWMVAGLILFSLVAFVEKAQILKVE